MAKYSQKCGPNVTDNFDDGIRTNDWVLEFSRNHTISGDGIITTCHAAEADNWKENYYIESGITELGDSCLSQPGIVRVSLPSTLEVIGNQCFKKSRITSITLPNGLKKIGHNNFPDSLTSLEIPALIDDFFIDNVVECGRLTSLTVADENTRYKSINGILYNHDCTEILFCPNAKIGTVVIPNSVKRIGDYCFAWCKTLTKVIIPFSVVEIGNNAFEGIEIDGLIIPSNVKFIGNKCFSKAKINDFKFSQAITSVPDGAFYDFEGKPVNFLSHIEKIGEESFSRSKNYKGIKPLSQTISLYAAKEIGTKAFVGATETEVFELFSSLDEIKAKAFSNTAKNVTIRCYSFAPPKVSDAAFADIGDEATLVVPKGAKSIYEHAIPWSAFPNIEEWEVSIDKTNETETPVSDEMMYKRLKSIAESKERVDRVYLREIILDSYLNYQYVDSDKDYEKAMALIKYNRSFSPAIIPDLEQQMCREWPYRYKLKLIDKTITECAMPLLISKESNDSLPIVPEPLSLPLPAISTAISHPIVSLGAISVFFNEDILKQIQDNLEYAQDSVKVAVSWFTNYSLFKQIKEIAERGVKVQIITNNDLINNGGYCLNLNELIDVGAEISLVEYPHLLHHKFCIIDDAIVINGSYNWTRFSAKNYENIMIVSGNEAVTELFIKEFEALLENAEHKCIDKMPNSVPEHPEYDRSAFKQYITEELDAEAREASNERDKITALHKASKLNPLYLKQINPDATNKYKEALRAMDDFVAMRHNIVEMAREKPIEKMDSKTGNDKSSISESNVSSSISTKSNAAIALSEQNQISKEDNTIIEEIKASTLSMVLDVSGSMDKTYQQGHVHNITKKALSASLALTNSKEVSLWIFGNDAKHIGNFGIDQIDEINKVGCRNEGTCLSKFVTKANDSIMDDSLVIIFTDDDVSSIQNAITGMESRKDVFWQIIVYGNEHTNISNTISNVNNTSVIGITDYKSLSDMKISQVLLEDYIVWKKDRLQK